MISDQMEDRPEDRKDEIRAMRAFLLAWFHHEPPSNSQAYSFQSLSNRYLTPPTDRRRRHPFPNRGHCLLTSWYRLTNAVHLTNVVSR